MWPFNRQPKVPEEKRTLHHYIFAHIALREVCHANPLGFFAMMGSPQRQQFLDDLLKEVREECDKDGEPSFSSRDIRIETYRIGGGYPAVLILMPTPKFIGEAHMVCIMPDIPVGELSQRKGQSLGVRYFTLEKGTHSESGTERTVLCAWAGESHVNYGDGPEARQYEFLEAVKKMI